MRRGVSGWRGYSLSETTTPVRLVRFELVPAFNFLWGGAIALYLFCT